jgi:single-stranded DNA-binding protein
MIHALITGVIFREVEQRTSKAGNAFSTATLRLRDGVFARVTVFGEAAQDFLQLSEGDAVAVHGRLKAELYQGKISLSIVADKILPLRAEHGGCDDPFSPLQPERPPNRRAEGLF